MSTPTMNDYYKVEVAIEPPSADFGDLAADLLASIGFESFEQHDDGTGLTAYVPAPLYDADAVADAMTELSPIAVASFDAEFIQGRDWNAEWEKNYFKPILVENLVAVHSSFHTDVPKARYDITIDPKMAFGTGHHATTSLMMRALLNMQVEGKTVVDMGTGSGILAILASMLGASAVTGIEIDHFAAVNAVDNVGLNINAQNGPVIIEGNATALRRLDTPADIFLANINRNIICNDIDRYAAAIKKGGTLIVSGFYVSDRQVIKDAAVAAGFEAVGADEASSWSSMTFRRL